MMLATLFVAFAILCVQADGVLKETVDNLQPEHKVFDNVRDELNLVRPATVDVGVSRHAYDGSLTIPRSEEAVGLSFSEMETPVGADVETAELTDVEIVDSSKTTKDGPVSVLLDKDVDKSTEFGKDADGKTVELPYVINFKFTKAVTVDSFAIKPRSKTECPKKFVVEFSEDGKDKWTKGKTMTISSARDDRLTWNLEAKGPAKFWRFTISETHAQQDKLTAISFVQFLGSEGKKEKEEDKESRPSNFADKMYNKLRDMWREQNTCKSNGLYCQCGFQEVGLRHHRIDRKNMDCYALVGICQLCKEPNPVKAIGFDYNYDSEKMVDEYALKTLHYYSSWKAPQYKFECKSGFIVTGVKFTYIRYEKLGDRDFYSMKIKCDRMKTKLSEEQIPDEWEDRRELSSFRDLARRRRLLFDETEVSKRRRRQSKESNSQKLRNEVKQIMSKMDDDEPEKKGAKKESKTAEQLYKKAGDEDEHRQYSVACPSPKPECSCRKNCDCVNRGCKCRRRCECEREPEEDGNDCRKKIGKYIRTLIGEEGDIFKLLKVKIQNMHMLNHIMREGMDKHLKKKIIAMHDMHDLIRSKMDPGNKKRQLLGSILEKVERMREQHRVYDEKLKEHFAQIQDRIRDEHEGLRQKLRRTHMRLRHRLRMARMQNNPTRHLHVILGDVRQRNHALHTANLNMRSNFGDRMTQLLGKLRARSQTLQRRGPQRSNGGDRMTKLLGKLQARSQMVQRRGPQRSNFGDRMTKLLGKLQARSKMVQRKGPQRSNFGDRMTKLLGKLQARSKMLQRKGPQASTGRRQKFYGRVMNAVSNFKPNFPMSLDANGKATGKETSLARDDQEVLNAIEDDFRKKAIKQPNGQKEKQVGFKDEDMTRIFDAFQDADEYQVGEPYFGDEYQLGDLVDDLFDDEDAVGTAPWYDLADSSEELDDEAEVLVGDVFYEFAAPRTNLWDSSESDESDELQVGDFDEFAVGEFDEEDVVDKFLLSQLYDEDEVALGDYYLMEDNYYPDEEIPLGITEDEAEPDMYGWFYTDEKDNEEEEVGVDDDEFEIGLYNPDEEFGDDLDDEFEVGLNQWTDDEYDVGNAADWGLEEELDGVLNNAQSQKMEDLQPVEVGDDFFDLDDKALVDDLVKQFGMDDTESMVNSAMDDSIADHETMVGVGLSALAESPMFWTNGKFTFAVVGCSLILLSLMSYIYVLYSQKGDNLDWAEGGDYVEHLLMRE